MSLSETQWKIITELSIKDKTPSELATQLNLSLPSIHTQLKQLEQQQFIYKEERRLGKTRPFTVYSLREGFLSITEAIPGEVRKVHLNANEEIKLHLRIWSIPQKKYHHFIESYWWKLEKYVENIEAMGIYGSVARGNAKDDSDIDILLLITDKRKVKKYSEEVGVKDVGVAGSSELVVAQLFDTDSFTKSLKNGSKYASEVAKDLIIIYDPHHKLKEIIDEYKSKW